MSENQILLEDRKKYFFLDIPFYRTLSTVQILTHLLSLNQGVIVEARPSKPGFRN